MTCLPMAPSSAASSKSTPHRSENRGCGRCYSNTAKTACQLTAMQQRAQLRWLHSQRAGGGNEVHEKVPPCLGARVFIPRGVRPGDLQHFYRRCTMLARVGLAVALSVLASPVNGIATADRAIQDRRLSAGRLLRKLHCRTTLLALNAPPSRRRHNRGCTLREHDSTHGGDTSGYEGSGVS
jgi:hypothetical protein